MFRRRGSVRQQQEQDHHELHPESKVNELKAALGPLSGHDLLYCTDACFKRYLEARNWNVDKAKKMLEDTLVWRSTFKPQEIRWHEISVEGETGKVFRANFRDRFGRTVLIMKPGRQIFKLKSLQNTTSMENQIRHLVYLIENAILNLPEDQEEMAWLIDFSGWSFSTNVPVRTARETISILQNHYPQRLAVAFLYSPPRIFEAFWKIVKYFLDPKTIQKVKFVYPKNKESVELMRSCFDVDNLPTEFGGKATMKYDHEDFSRLMLQDDLKTAKFWGLEQKTPSAATNGIAEESKYTEC
ncbi:Cellular retinaldehyde binding/alpha-tocopherol transport [Cynara cardunculus var. scolymus]|uniref:Cellular retinaldehyde binding/alpha-tocopherol transport n=1 Tax=Cynara cardunculus var. scolymus TaxID=59895 RepID=A0A103YCJ8_CYNCS|nr:Cellular retinaldehyde binding/alpha-tocopherol transport [Cynara cardunculus var. scolymus]